LSSRTFLVPKAAQPKPEGNTMSDLMLKTAVATKVRVNGWKNTTVQAMQRRAGDKGQTAVEYLGIIAVVVAIVLAITGTNIGQTILTKIQAQIAKVAP
jgi:pilus assembly protein Flp/PilA